MKVAASPRSMTKSQLFRHSLSHIRRLSPLRMTKRGDAQRQYELIREYHLLKKGGEAATSTLNLEP